MDKHFSQIKIWFQSNCWIFKIAMKVISLDNSPNQQNQTSFVYRPLASFAFLQDEKNYKFIKKNQYHQIFYLWTLPTKKPIGLVLVSDFIKCFEITKDVQNKNLKRNIIYEALKIYLSSFIKDRKVWLLSCVTLSIRCSSI